MGLADLHGFFTGIGAMGWLVATAFFLRFWRETKDRLFLLFSVAFAALALNRVLLAVLAVGRESLWYLYLIRLSAFVIIAWAVIDKNRRA